MSWRCVQCTATQLLIITTEEARRGLGVVKYRKSVTATTTRFGAWSCRRGWAWGRYVRRGGLINGRYGITVATGTRRPRGVGIGARPDVVSGRRWRWRGKVGRWRWRGRVGRWRLKGKVRPCAFWVIATVTFADGPIRCATLCVSTPKQ